MQSERSVVLIENKEPVERKMVFNLFKIKIFYVHYVFDFYTNFFKIRREANLTLTYPN